MKKKYCDVGQHECDKLFHTRTKERLSSCPLHAPRTPIKPKVGEIYKIPYTAFNGEKQEGHFRITSITPSNKAVGTVKKPKPISKLSDKEKKRQVAYMALKKEHMKRYPLCQAHLIGCLGVSTDIHHLFMGADRLKYFLDTTTWKTVCRNCHSTIHDKLSNEKLIELGLRLKE